MVLMLKEHYSNELPHRLYQEQFSVISGFSPVVLLGRMIITYHLDVEYIPEPAKESPFLGP
jgi:hypothetical protein